MQELLKHGRLNRLEITPVPELMVKPFGTGAENGTDSYSTPNSVPDTGSKRKSPSTKESVNGLNTELVPIKVEAPVTGLMRYRDSLCACIAIPYRTPDELKAIPARL